MLTIYISFLLLGVLVGVLAGLFGFGGGLVIVPAVASFIVIYKPEFATNSMHIAVATSLFTMLFTSIKAAHSHHKAKNIVWGTALKLKIGLIFGTVFWLHYCKLFLKYSFESLICFIFDIYSL